MSLLIESIKLVDGKFFNLSYHQERVSRSIESLFPSCEVLQLSQLLGTKELPDKGWYKCRIVYDDVQAEVQFSPYKPRTIKRIKIVDGQNIEYPFKFADRSAIDRLFAMRGDCDDVLITVNGKVTDCSYSNVVFRKGSRWFTPDSPLLRGTMREQLVRENKAEVREIRIDDIRSFDSVRIVNALLEFDGPEVDVSDIVF